MNDYGSTHVNAFAHLEPGGQTIEEMDLKCLVERSTALGWGALTTVSPSKSTNPTPQKLQ